MANEDLLERLKRGMEEWNAWREGKGKGVRLDLKNADLKNANLRNTDLKGADLTGADLRRTDLEGADLRYVDLEGADLRRATLSYANLSGADLTSTNLRFANLRFTAFVHAALSSSDLSHANLVGAKLVSANLNGAVFGFTSLGSLDLSGILGLAEAYHTYPSTVGADTLESTAHGLAKAPPERRGEVETFLGSAGVENHLIEFYRSRIGLTANFYSAFISYSHADQAFALRLYADLKTRGIRCWLDEKDGRVGDPIYEAVNQAIRSNDRVILCCSFASLTSKWVDKELTMTFDREDRLGQPILLPLDLDGALFDWDGAKAAMVRERIAARFKGWDTDARLYEERLQRVVEAMRPRGGRDGE